MHSFKKKSFLFDLLTRSWILITRMAIKLILVIRRSFLERRITKITLGTRGFSRVRWEFSVLAERRHIFGRRPKPLAAKPREKPLARSGAFYRPRWPLSFFIGLHLRQSDWKSPTVIMWAGTWRNVQRPTLSLEKQLRV